MIRTGAQITKRLTGSVRCMRQHMPREGICIILGISINPYAQKAHMKEKQITIKLKTGERYATKPHL